MKTRSLHTLLQRAVDGTLSDMEMQELRGKLQRNPGLAQELETQKEMASLLDGIPAVEPPANLTETILQAVKAHKAQQRARERRPFRMPVINIKYVYSFSAGLALGLLILFVVHRNLLSGSSLQPSEVSGTIRLSDSGWQSKTITGAKVHGQISWKNDPSVMDVQLILKPQQSAEIVFDYEKNHLQLRGIRNEAGAPLQGLYMADGKLTLAVTQLCKLSLSFDRQNMDAAPVQFVVKKNNELYFSYQLD